MTVETLKRYKEIAQKAIDQGKTPEVQQARIEAIDEILKQLKPKPN